MQEVQEENINMTRLKELYQNQIRPALKRELEFDNDLAVPRLEKIVVNAGIGRLLQQHPKALDQILETLKKITGQRPVATRARVAISSFKIRAGQVVGIEVTLRGKRMYDFLDKLINATLPRTRDFRGLSRKGFDGHGNYSLGLRDQIVFPEMAQEDLELTFGLQVTIVTTAKNDEQAYQLLKKMGFPFSAQGGKD